MIISPANEIKHWLQKMETNIGFAHFQSKKYTFNKRFYL